MKQSRPSAKLAGMLALASSLLQNEGTMSATFEGARLFADRVFDWGTVVIWGNVPA